MKKEIIIHIGLAKTATTTIQKFMHSNAKLLLDNNIYYPTLYSNHGRMLVSIIHGQPETLRFNIQAELTAKQASARNTRHQNIIEAKLKDKKIKKVIFSGEALSSLNDELIVKLRQWLTQFSDKITIICCTRNPIDWHTSLAQQKLKSRRSTISSYGQNHSLSRMGLSYMAVKSYMRHFGAENVIVYDFDKHKHQLYQKFLQCCQLDTALISQLTTVPLSTHNSSFSQEGALIQDALNRSLTVDPTKRISFKETKYLLSIKGQKFQLEKNQLIKVLEKKQGDIKWLAETFNAECGYYSDWPATILENEAAPPSLFQKETIESLAIIIDNLATENAMLRNGTINILPLKVKQLLKRLIRCLHPLKSSRNSKKNQLKK